MHIAQSLESPRRPKIAHSRSETTACEYAIACICTLSSMATCYYSVVARYSRSQEIDGENQAILSEGKIKNLPYNQCDAGAAYVGRKASSHYRRCSNQAHHVGFPDFPSEE